MYEHDKKIITDSISDIIDLLCNQTSEAKEILEIKAMGYRDDPERLSEYLSVGVISRTLTAITYALYDILDRIEEIETEPDDIQKAQGRKELIKVLTQKANHIETIYFGNVVAILTPPEKADAAEYSCQLKKLWDSPAAHALDNAVGGRLCNHFNAGYIMGYCEAKKISIDWLLAR